MNEKLNNHLKWAFFGGVAVAIYNKSFHREFEDIDIIIEDSERLKNLFNDLNIKNRKGRKRGYLKANGIPIEFLFMKDKNSIELADGEYSFNSIESVEFNNSVVPVVDLDSLYQAKLRYKRSLNRESKKHKNKIINSILDLEIIEKIIEGNKK